MLNVSVTQILQIRIFIIIYLQKDTSSDANEELDLTESKVNSVLYICSFRGWFYVKVCQISCVSLCVNVMFLCLCVVHYCWGIRHHI